MWWKPIGELMRNLLSPLSWTGATPRIHLVLIDAATTAPISGFVVTCRWTAFVSKKLLCGAGQEVHEWTGTSDEAGVAVIPAYDGLQSPVELYGLEGKGTHPKYGEGMTLIQWYSDPAYCPKKIARKRPDGGLEVEVRIKPYLPSVLRMEREAKGSGE